MTTYTFIPDADLAAERPITTGLMTKLARNPEAIIEGAVGAPRATARIITPGGSAADGPLDDAATPTLPGFYEATEVEITAPKSWPWISLVRVDGDVTISDVLSLRRPRSDVQSLADQAAILSIFDGLSGAYGTLAPGPGDDETDGGGGAIGAGGASATGIAQAPAVLAAAFNAYRAALNRRVLVGGNSQKVVGGSDEARGGGCLILLINGDFDCTGGTIDASGDNGASATGGDDGNGGAGAGSILVFCTGTLTGGTFLAKGGAGRNDGSGERGAGGGGGLVGLFAATFTGTQIRTVTGGTATSPAVAGGDGLDLGNVTLTEPQINALMFGTTG